MKMGACDNQQSYFFFLLLTNTDVINKEACVVCYGLVSSHSHLTHIVKGIFLLLWGKKNDDALP